MADIPTKAKASLALDSPRNFHPGRKGLVTQQVYDPIAVVLGTTRGSLVDYEMRMAEKDARFSVHWGIGLDGDVHPYVDLADAACAGANFELNTRWVGPPNVPPEMLMVVIATEDSQEGDTEVGLRPVTAEQFESTRIQIRIARDRYPTLRWLVAEGAAYPISRNGSPGKRWMGASKFNELAAKTGLMPRP